MDEVIVDVEGHLGRIRLNRPKALNALNHPMVGLIDRALDWFAADPAVTAVLLTGEGERALCAGGDLRSLYENETAFAEDFWRDEYRLDSRISRYEKPFVAVMDGITMGGGVGLSGHAAHRIVTERSRVAMPETGIGYFPDVGGTWLLPRAPGELGTYLGLTGAQIGAADAILCGMADAFMPCAAVPDLAAALTAGEDVPSAIARLRQDPGPAPLSAHRPVIDRCFAYDGVDEILTALAADGSDFAAETRTVLLTKAPSSLVLTLCLLRLGRVAPSLEACLEREFHASLALLAEGDFREGIRAAVIDKDKTPRWNPASLAAVDPARIARWLETRAEPVFTKDRTGPV
ncbi:enoyl-CoA hydratase/isomerase family protein [Methylobacterium persicinum]|uniref:3-hydroxyisobutyryl-CoA hydrolase n=1 Tax=Methylobacterium persicinum TaxID=374426 RepID=A0ABU0HRX4_9HYPH|nr:enoyl-CoA hydratase/isomerase family protein [Methylobacterium persicinum]MDQ0445088.1 enoyl-CoA hydratase [Methylobacterium persicinum]GJE40712.1 Carnitinyl-CoA dehydratase [Methylobacterium persicinum]